MKGLWWGRNRDAFQYGSTPQIHVRQVCADSLIAVAVSAMHRDQWVRGALTVCHTSTREHLLLLINGVRILKRPSHSLVECYLVTDQRSEFHHHRQ